MKTAIKQLADPFCEPISLAQAKGWLLIGDTITDHDDTINNIIAAMREDVENLTHRAFIQRQFRLTMDQWPTADLTYGSKIELPFPPLVSVDAFKYIDLNGDLQTLATDQYVVHLDYEPGIIVPVWNVIWPIIRRVPNALQITFTAGYPLGSPSSDVAAAQDNMPAKLRLWMQTKLATIFENREHLMSANVVKVPRDFTDGLLDSLIVGTRLF